MKRKRKKLELFREQQRAQSSVVGKATENIQKVRKAIGFKANGKRRESLFNYRFTCLLDLTTEGVLLTLSWSLRT